MDQIKRIEKMEKRLDASASAVLRMTEALDEYENTYKAYKELADYYGSGLWMKDYEDDEKGVLPKDLKRGVLSEDAVYDLICENHEIAVRMMKLVLRMAEDKSI